MTSASRNGPGSDTGVVAGRKDRRAAAWLRAILLRAAPFALALTAACAGGEGDHDADITTNARSAKPVVVTSVLPQAYAVERIAGDLVEVEVMIPPGASPSTHEPSIRQLEALSTARVYVKVGHPGFPFERSWLERLLGDHADLEVVDTSAGIEVDDHDPHVWVSPPTMRTMAKNIHASLVRILPDDRSALDDGLESFLAEIDEVDREIRATLAPAAGRRFFVFHPAWGYLASDYGLVQVAIERHGKEPDAHNVAEIIDEARAAGVKTIFVQPQLNPASARLVASEIRASVTPIDPLARDWSTNLRAVARLLARDAVE